MFDKNKYLLDYSYSSDVGKVRLVNEDSVLVTSNSRGEAIMLLADGLGGHNKGDYASKIAIKYLCDEFKNKKKGFITRFDIVLWCQRVLGKLNKIILNEANNNPIYKGMGTTIVIAILHRNTLCVCNIGDSRAYIIKNNKLTKISEDQSVVDYLKRSGQINEEQAEKRNDKNILTEALGTLPSINYNFKIYRYHNEDIMICSDGLTNNVKEEEILSIIQNNKNSKDTVNSLIARANLNGGSDNISIGYLKRRKI